VVTGTSQAALRYPLMHGRIEKLTPIYEGWLSLSMASVRMDDGAVVERELIDHPSGAAVLLYNPTKRTALVLTQLRPPVESLGEDRLLEVVAGILDEPDAASCAQREAMEEAGVHVRELEPVARLWLNPLSSLERLDCFLGAYSDEDRVGEGGGLVEEHEELNIIELTLSDLWQRAESGHINDAKTFILLQALRIRRPDLF
jgi:nudix-type nucleoside diphosphatase (YffH/AdpP family)